MNHYAMLGALGFRVAATLLVLYSVIVLVIGAVGARLSSPAGLFIGFVGVVAGMVLFAAAPSLGRLAARGLSESTMPPNER
jgi:hypothetical protein